MRVVIYADIVSQECSQNCSTFLTVSDKTIPKSTLSQHFRELREAGLIRSERRGVEVHNTSRCAELEQRFPGLIRAIVNAHAIQSRHEAQGKKRAAQRRARHALKNRFKEPDSAPSIKHDPFPELLTSSAFPVIYRLTDRRA